MTDTVAPKTSEKAQLLLVTGMSGAGRSTALRALEDIGFEAVDNLPLSLLPRLAAYETKSGQAGRPLAVGVDVRSREFSAGAIGRELERARKLARYGVSILFIDCGEETLIGRFKETRRPHPLSPDRRVADGIRLERRLTEGIRDMADQVIDTSTLTVWQFREKVKALYAVESDHAMSVSVTSFSYRKGVPRDADLVFDVRFLKNPHYVAELRDFTGLDPKVADYIRGDEIFEAFFGRLTGLLSLTLPRYAEEGKSHLSIAVGCTGGKHRSVFVAEELSKWVAKRGGYRAHSFHREQGPEAKS
ncbi:RNase adapter RapZ [Aestuariispira ectoiniformans]|uniref:RNase adapter RapZ n=1 Tax=Aestuariispira ectoiniformans TaxID=2775080 RepID=UPI00223B0972|nr:RNase adapter RapZ [Aestuariispira ectoiniformans]